MAQVRFNALTSNQKKKMLHYEKIETQSFNPWLGWSCKDTSSQVNLFKF